MAYITPPQGIPLNIYRGVARALKNRDFDFGRTRDKPPAFTQTEKLIGITLEAHEELMSATSVFPFALFPDTITVDRQKLTIIHRQFFGVGNIVNVQIGDILNVEAHLGPLFAALRLSSKYFIDNHQEITYLRRSEAVKLQRIIQGYMIAHHRDIDCSGIDKDQLIILLNDLGQEAQKL
ncbi:MAG: hypothetical protein JWO96_189 [Candidatus Saccharibacteria bacterium]|nr:hypothetical protein [Candidatus Saccharibacteria bacterium]